MEINYPLAQCHTGDLKSICQILWDWAPCEGCQNDEPCNDFTCSWHRYVRLGKTFETFYKAVTSKYVPDFQPNVPYALRSHDDVVAIIRLLKTNKGKTLSDLTSQYFGSRAAAPAAGAEVQAPGALAIEAPPPPVEEHPPREGLIAGDGQPAGLVQQPVAVQQLGALQQPGKPPEPEPDDQYRAFSIAVNIISMVPCSIENQWPTYLGAGTSPQAWHRDTTFEQFQKLAFPKAAVTSKTKGMYEKQKTQDIGPSLVARRLKKLAKLKFKGTDDLRRHLRLDTREGIVYIYRQTSVIKEHLLAAERQGLTQPQNGVVNITYQVALEVLHSTQKILFPYNTESEQMLQELIPKEGLDPECDDYDLVNREPFSGDSDGIEYSYFVNNLVDLYEEVENPTPRGRLNRWLQRKSGDRYVMMATIASVLIALVLGFASVALAGYQSWLAYQAWKYPTSPASGN